MRVQRRWVKRTELKPPGEAGPNRQQWYRRDNRDSDEGKRDSAALRDMGRVERAQGVPERSPVASGLLADDKGDAARMHQQPRGDLEHALAEPAREHREQLVHSWVWRPGAVAAASMLMAVAGTCWLGPDSQEEPPEVVRAEAPVRDTAPDAGTRGLGDSTSTARMAAQEAPVASKSGAITQTLEKPLLGQMRPPCRVQGQVEINGGCWQRFADVRPPCTSGTYEWKGACYWPVLARPRVQPRTAKPPR